ncbi:uncharacterized protein BYT42DRAFT_563301 [Radiomyces spectabilis]|uniref:uncharacterized protein n=1 Tax=Radiomyces spectabilis TaxID=64574 RepID=UPI002220F0BE|nr:uncharacterized protein BYT42DRAFT_563301 [Radiomyces spectabilis]KAI8384683.1 hypothetical protein BYT42DRAFT_563301 [Radiomyces spectabilis]
MPILSSNILTLPLLLPTPNLASSPTPDTQVSRPVPLSVSSQALPGSSIPSHTPMMQPSTFPSDPPATSNNSTESGLPGIAIAGICIGLGVLLSSILTIALIRRARKASPDKALKSGPRYTKPQRYGSTTSVILTASPTEDPAWPQPIGTFTVIATYTPTLDDELPIQPGDRVLVYMEYDDGWCLGATMSGTRGVFPKHCISQTE